MARVAQGGKKGTHSSSRSLSESGREEWFSSDLADHHIKPENRVLEMNGDRPSTPRSLHETAPAHTNLLLNTRESLKAARHLDAREENTNSELSSDKNYRTKPDQAPSVSSERNACPLDVFPACPPPSSWPLQQESLRETLVRILNRPRRDTNEVGEIEAAVA